MVTIKIYLYFLLMLASAVIGLYKLIALGSKHFIFKSFWGNPLDSLSNDALPVVFLFLSAYIFGILTYRQFSFEERSEDQLP